MPPAMALPMYPGHNPWPMFDPHFYYAGLHGSQAGPPGPPLLQPKNMQTSLDRTRSMSSNEDQDREPYPFVASFFLDIASANLHRPALRDIVWKFENQDLFSIEEVAQLTEGSL